MITRATIYKCISTPDLTNLSSKSQKDHTMYHINIIKNTNMMMHCLSYTCTLK